jgi:hypothetical protein
MTRMGGVVSRQEVDFSTIYNFCCCILNERAQGNVVGGMAVSVRALLLHQPSDIVACPD